MSAACIPIAEVNGEAVAIFALVVSITLGITYWASQRTKHATTSGPRGAASPESRTGSRSRATTCRRPRSWESPG